METKLFFDILKDAMMNRFDKQTLCEMTADEWCSFTKADVDDFFTALNTRIEKAYKSGDTFASVAKRFEENGYYSSQTQMLDDNILYVCAAIKEGKFIDGASINIYIYKYVKANHLDRKKKIENLLNE